MPKLNLSQTYIHSGKFYGPGEADLPDEAYTDLKAREDALKGDQPDEAPAESTPSTAADPLAEFPELHAAGYTSAESVRAATDDELLALDGVGPATLKKIRAATRE